MNRLSSSVSRRVAVVAAVCMLAGIAQGASVTVSLPKDAKGVPGAAVSVPIRIRGAQGMGSLQCELTYDPSVLEVKEVAAAETMPPVLLESNVVAPGRLRIALAGNQAVNGDGQIDVRFDVKSAGNSDLVLENTQAWQLDGGLDMLVTVEPGRLTATGGANMILWIAIVGGAILVVVAIVLAARRKRPAA